MSDSTGAGWLLDTLAANGVRHLFGNPGSTELPILDAFLGRDSPQFFLGLHEMAVMGMADGFAQATGQLAAVNVHVQPGLANAMAGILNAARARVPLLVTVGQQMMELLPGDPFLGGELVAMAAPIAKGAVQVDRARDLPRTIVWAAKTALTHPRGPVVVSLPLDVQVATVRAPVGSLVALPAPPPEESAILAAAERLQMARAPVILCGDGVAHAGAGPVLARLAERLGAPILAEPFAAQVAIDPVHPLWAGWLPGFASDIRTRLQGYDLVVAIGMPVFRLFGWSPGGPLAEGTELVHMDVDPNEVGKTITPSVGLVGCPKRGLDALLEALGPAGQGVQARRNQVAGDISRSRRAARAATLIQTIGPQIGPAAFSAAVAQTVRPRDIIVEESLTAARQLRTMVPRRAPGSWFSHRGSALGWGLPAAVGVKLARPGRTVICLHGDGSLLFGVHALWSAAHHNAPIAVVVADNGGYEILRAGLEGLTGRAQDAWPGLVTPGLSVETICQGFGASAARVEHPTDLPEALMDLRRRASEGPAVLVASVAGTTPPVGYRLPR